MDQVPFVDDHTRAVDAPAEVAWQAASDLLDVEFRGLAGRYARLVGVSGGRPFVVERAEPPFLLAFSGEHRFSQYRLTFSLRRLSASRCAITAHTSAVFPGRLGRLYKLVVIDSRAHVLMTRRLLRQIARRAERSPLER